MGIVGSDAYKSRPFWTNEPRYQLKDCRCGASQLPNRDVSMAYNGGFWIVKCYRCGLIICGETQEEAAKNWNGGELL